MKYKLKELREDHDKNQDELAVLLHMSRQNYSRIENEVTILSFDDAIKIAKFYNVSLEELLFKRSDELILTKQEYEELKKAAEIILSMEQYFYKK